MYTFFIDTLPTLSFFSRTWMDFALPELPNSYQQVCVWLSLMLNLLKILSGLLIGMFTDSCCYTLDNRSLQSNPSTISSSTPLLSDTPAGCDPSLLVSPIEAHTELANHCYSDSAQATPKSSRSACSIGDTKTTSCLSSDKRASLVGRSAPSDSGLSLFIFTAESGVSLSLLLADILLFGCVL